MVEEWKIGDKFEVLTDRIGYYLKKGDKGICYGTLIHEKAIYFNFDCSTSIHINRIKKLNAIPIYELW